MTSKNQSFPDDRTAPERRKGLSEQEIKDLELAGGVEGGMQAGRGGPPPADEDDEDSGQSAHSSDDKGNTPA